jgi:hypothetical protein
MKKNIIGLCVSLILVFLLTGCDEDYYAWSDIRLSNTNSPMRDGESFIVTAHCSLTSGRNAPQCDNYDSINNDNYQVSSSCIDNDNGSLDVVLDLKPSPIKSGQMVESKSIVLKCGSGADYVDLTVTGIYARPVVTIVPSSTVESMITLSPGQQQQLTVTLPNIESTPIGSKFTILESQQYLSFIGNESSCTINANQSSCSVTVKANNNITTTVNQTLRVVTSEFPTESVFIKIAPSGPKYIFVSQSTTAGNFGGFAAADTICNNDHAKIDYPTQLGSGTFKALLNGNNATVIGTEYKNLAGESIATATTTNLVAQDTGLTNPIGKTPSGTQDGQYAWTGLARTGTPASDCVNWTNAAPGQSLPDGTVGYVSVNYASWAVSSSSPTSACWVNNIHLYCVQQ